jgi:hypothetical protein
MAETPEANKLDKPDNTWQVGEHGISWPANRPSVG